MADQCRAKAGLPAHHDPMRFELGDIPYVNFSREGLIRNFSFEAKGEDLWVATYNQLKLFRGAGPFTAENPIKTYEFQRTTQSSNTCICVSPDFIWMGTADDGLLELDRKSGACRRITMKDGLYFNGITCLCLQGRTLWIAYKNDQTGAVGTLDLNNRRFSTFTPDLSPGAGTNSQSSYEQSKLDDIRKAPQHPSKGMVEANSGEMWFAVIDKGIQRYRSSDASWDTVRITEAEEPLSMKYISTIAADVLHGQLLVPIRERLPFYCEKSVTGGLFIHNYRHNNDRIMRIYQGLPSNDLTAVAVDGRIAWLGGRGFVAILDTQELKVLKVAYISANLISKIQLGKTHAWIQVTTRGEGYDFEYGGNAWTGVYRIDRSAVEPALDTENQK
jgi:hypothetical protein